MSYSGQRFAPTISIEQLNEAYKRPAYAQYLLASGVILGFIALTVHLLISLLLWGLAVYVSTVVKKSDDQRRTSHLEYQMDPLYVHQWSSLNQALATLAKSQQVWKINTEDRTYDWKHHGGANFLLTRANASIRQCSAPNISSNIVPFCIDIVSQKFFFFPDRIYMLSGGNWSGVEYSSLSVEVGKTQFIESMGVPRDSTTVGQTWQYVNKSGGPDRRFNNNPQIPIALYGLVDLKSSSGISIILHISNSELVGQFYSLYCAFQKRDDPVHSYQQNAHSRPAPKNQDSTSQKKTRPNHSTPKEPTVKKKTCYEIMELTKNCTKEEAASKYRQLAMSYHPDRVNHMAKDFQDLANQKLREINLAYEELKLEKGW